MQCFTEYILIPHTCHVKIEQLLEYRHVYSLTPKLNQSKYGKKLKCLLNTFKHVVQF